jgi:hypothetical protein
MVNPFTSHGVTRGNVLAGSVNLRRTTDCGVHLPSYAIAGARLTLAHGALSAALFVDNVTNNMALMTANNTQFQVNIPQLVRYTTNPLRTAGLQLDYRF